MNKDYSTQDFHAFCLAAPRSGEGKTSLTIALLRLFANKGLQVQGFKCGPDYIDTEFHKRASKKKAYNLDTWMLGIDGVKRLWQRHNQGTDLAICEGVMGLFDGRDIESLEGSSAHVAQNLEIPVVLVFNARGMAGSIVALVRGFHEECTRHNIRLAGVIANYVGSPRHKDILQKALERAKLPPLLGAIPRDPAWIMPERHLGLLPPEEFFGDSSNEKSSEKEKAEKWFDALAQSAEKHIDIDKLLSACRVQRPQKIEEITNKNQQTMPNKGRIAIAKDKAFCLYYEENERVLKEAGFELVTFSPLHDKELPKDAQALYIGGGYPEVFAKELAENAAMRQAIFDFAEQGGHVYAEDAGLVYLCKNIEITDKINNDSKKSYPLCAVFDATATMGDKVQSLGYREVELFEKLPFGFENQEAKSEEAATGEGFRKHFRGHEFHWTNIKVHKDYPSLYKVQSKYGTSQEGLVYKNVKAGYVRLYWGNILAENNNLNIQNYLTFTQEDDKEQGLVILINGPSSAGKSSLAKALQKKLQGSLKKTCFSLDIDSTLRQCAPDFDKVLLAVKETKLPIIEIFHASIAEATRSQSLVIVDHVIGEDKSWIADLLGRLQDIDVLSVQLTCDLKTLKKREEGRKDRKTDWQHAKSQAENIHKELPNQVFIDNSKKSPQACAEELFALIQKKSPHIFIQSEGQQ